jgi:hypothetical protein
MSLWPQAVLCFHPGHSWLAAWEQHSVRLLQQMTSSELASCGWALSVLRYRPQPQWLAAWSQAVAQHIGGAALVPPHVLSLLLYSSATLSCPVNTAWLKAAGQAAARQAGSWAAADVADGFWGLGQLGLRAAAAEEVLEVLVSRLVAATAPAMDLQQLGPHRQLQVLQAAVLLGGGLSDLQEQQQQQRPQRQQWRQQRRRRQAKLRWLNFRAWRASLVARQAAAVAAAAAAQAGNGTNPGSSTSSSSSLASRDALARIVGKAAVVSRKYVKLRTGKDPAEAAAAGLLRPAWFVHWCRCSLGQLHSWGPQQVAAAFGAFAAMQWQPPPAWQQQMLAHVMQPGGMSVRTATALQDALVALQSPFVTSWRAPLAVTYMPGAPQQRQQGQQGQQGQQYSQESSQQHSQQQQQLMTRPGRRRELSHPHHLRGGAMRHLRRRHHLMRLVGWWRQQQLLQQQYAVQRQQQQEDMEAEWRAAAAAAGLGGFGTSGFDNSGYTSSSSAGSSGYSSDANSAGDTSSASTSSASSGSSVTRGVLSAVPAGLQPRRLESTSLGHQLQRPTMRPAAAAVASAGAPVEAAAPADVTHAATGAGSSGGSTRDGASPAAGSGLTAAGLDTIGSSSSSSRPFDGGQAVAGSAAAAPDTSSNNGISTGSSNTPNAGPVIGNSAVPGPAGVVQVVRADSAAVMPASAAAAWCNWATVGPAGQMDTGASDTAAAGVLGPLLQSGGGPVWKQ